MKISHVIIPAAGLGTRFLPYTKTIAKEMLPIGNVPAIEYIIQEGMRSQIKDFCIIINKQKDQIRNYFTKDTNLEKLLLTNNKLHLLDSLYEIIDNATFTYIEQQLPLGLGHAILMAKDYIHSDNYFGVMLPDDIICNQDIQGLKQLIDVAQDKKATVIAVQEVDSTHIGAYGVVAIESQISDSIFKVKHLVEKPKPQDAPSNLGIIGRYILSPKIFDSLAYLNSQRTTGELQLTDAIAHLAQSGQSIYAVKIQGTRYDVGTPAGWYNAVVNLGAPTNL